MSVLETVNRTQLKQNLELALVEVAVYNFTMRAYDDLRRQLKRNEITPERARLVWKIRHACYECFMAHLKAERLKEIMVKV